VKNNMTLDLNRFIDSQEPIFAAVLEELQAGNKRTHWMWFIFPQLRCLGHSETAKYYGINGLKEARSYLQHPVLGPRLIACIQPVLTHSGTAAVEIFGRIDAKKFQSCLTLFLEASDESKLKELLNSALMLFYKGHTCTATLKFLRDEQDD